MLNELAAQRYWQQVLLMPALACRCGELTNLLGTTLPR